METEETSPIAKLDMLAPKQEVSRVYSSATTEMTHDQAMILVEAATDAMAKAEAHRETVELHQAEISALPDSPEKEAKLEVLALAHEDAERETEIADAMIEEAEKVMMSIEVEEAARAQKKKEKKERKKERKEGKQKKRTERL